MMKFRITLLALIIPCSFVSIAQSGEDWRTLKEQNYEIMYPSSWELSQSGQMGTNFILLSPQEGDQDQFRENVNLLIQDLSQYDISLQQFVEISENQIKKMIAESNLLSSDRIEGGELEYQRVVYTGKQGVYDLKFVQFYMMQDKKAYILTFTSEQTSFNDFSETGERILSSFKLSD